MKKKSRAFIDKRRHTRAARRRARALMLQRVNDASDDSTDGDTTVVNEADLVGPIGPIGPMVPVVQVLTVALSNEIPSDVDCPVNTVPNNTPTSEGC
jgi:hypothetical protein